MSKKHITTERLCRLNGEKPTARDRWLAFYRLYRLSMGHGAFQDMAAVDAFRTLFRDWRFIRLLESEERSPSRAHVPRFLRRRLLDMDRRRRLHGDHPEWAERDKAVANHVHNEHGMEVTPDEVAAVRRKIITIARQKAAEQGIAVPADDEELLRLLKPTSDGYP